MLCVVLGRLGVEKAEVVEGEAVAGVVDGGALPAPFSAPLEEEESEERWCSTLPAPVPLPAPAPAPLAPALPVVVAAERTGGARA